jgi:hypothetical protein
MALARQIEEQRALLDQQGDPTEKKHTGDTEAS